MIESYNSGYTGNRTPKACWQDVVECEYFPSKTAEVCRHACMYSRHKFVTYAGKFV